jgi:serine/threonine protein kinase
MRTIFSQGQVFNSWTLTKYLGGGGNGEVWKCENELGISKAIKLLKKVKPKSYLRFIDETNVIEQNSDIPGLIPIEEKSLPKVLNSEVPFFIMPLAESSESKIFNRTLVEKIDAVIEIAKTLAILHSRKIYHRDIKPANILFYNSSFCLADFGLVDYPNKKEISLKNEEIGAKWTMAPEMKRESSSADLAKSDIYSLAKTQRF